MVTRPMLTDDEMNAAVTEAMFGTDPTQEHQIRGQIVASNLRLAGYTLSIGPSYKYPSTE